MDLIMCPHDQVATYTLFIKLAAHHATKNGKDKIVRKKRKLKKKSNSTSMSDGGPTHQPPIRLKIFP